MVEKVISWIASIFSVYFVMGKIFISNIDEA